MELLSVVVPCYNEEQVLNLFLAELARVIGQWDELSGGLDTPSTPPPSFEVILVDDGSCDATLEVMRSAAASEEYPFLVRYISFSRNFGKEAALLAGLEAARGSLVATMDVDMQDPPSLLPQMYSILTTEDCDNVATCRTTREGEPALRSWFARMFYRLINRISDADIVDGARDFRLMKRPMVDAILSMREYNRFSKGIYGWVGFRTKWLPYVNVERAAGETKWSFWSLFRYALEGIIAFSTAPLTAVSLIGLLLCLLAFVAVIFIALRALIFGDPVSGWPSLACIMVFLGGLQLMCLGVIGQYLARTYLETKRRPIYIVRESGESRARS